MRLLVTGASGFVGRALCRHLAIQGYELRPIVRKPSAVPGEIVLSENDAAGWQQALQGCQSVLHLAGRAHAMPKYANDSLQAFRDANVGTTLTLAHRAAQASVRRIVFVSSIKVNGEATPPGRRFCSDDDAQPSDPYAISKWEAEQGLRSIAQANRMECVIVRPPLVYGPGVKGNFAQLLSWVDRSLPLPLGAVHNQRSMIALDNLIGFLTLCVLPDQSPHASGQTFMISDGVTVSTPELVRKIAMAYRRKPKLLPVPASLLRLFASLIGQRSAVDRLLGSLVIDDSPARQILGWKPQITMDEQLQRMADAVPS
jgi:nucleoside-diphosphate-sugar epimerase